jgi:hypothetical protein
MVVLRLTFPRFNHAPNPIREVIKIIPVPALTRISVGGDSNKAWRFRMEFVISLVFQNSGLLFTFLS